MRIVCPSSSFESLVGSQAAPSKKKQTRVKQPEGRKRCSQRLKEREQKAAEAVKQTVKKAQIVQPPKWTINYLYVGNLSPATTEPKLWSEFSKYGKIKAVILRCSQGQYVTAAVPTTAITQRDLHYASVEFVKPDSARRALKLDGTTMDHRQIVVTISVANLPEVKNITAQRLAAMRMEQATKARPLGRTDTEEFIDYREPASDRNRVRNVSFAKTTM